MKINSTSPSPLFGTKIIIRDKNKLYHDIHNKFSKQILKRFTEPMCDFWTSVDELPINYIKKKRKFNFNKINLLKGKKYKANKDIFGYTKEVDICTAGIVVTQNNKLGMFHIAPTLENFDLLFNRNNDCFGSSIDSFSRKNGKIKKTIIVGGKQPAYSTSRGEKSIEINSFIRKRFEDRGIKTTILSDFKQYLCDIFYSTNKDILEIGTCISPNNNHVNDIFGEVLLQSDDSIKFMR